MNRAMVPLGLAAALILPNAWFATQAQTYLLQDHGARWYGRLVALLLLLGLFAQYSLINRFRFELRARAKGCLPAKVYPHKDPILGIDLFLDSLSAIRQHCMQDRFKERFDDVGRTFWSTLLGSWALVTDDPENVKTILASSFDDFPIAGPRLYSVLPVLGPRSIFTTNGKQWHETRAMIRPSFVRDQVADLECFDRHISNLLARIPRDGRTFDIQELLMCMTMDSSTDFLLGYSTDTLRTPSAEAKAFVEAFEACNMLGSQKAILGRVTFLLPSPALNRAVATVRRFISTYMDQALEETRTQKRERSYLFLDELIKSGASHDYIVDQLASIIIAGRDTTAGAMSACFYFLARSPEAVRRVRAEIEELGVATPTFEQLRGMKYMSNVVKEALRLFPPVPTNSRETNKETVLPRGGGPDGKAPMLVPKGTLCRFSLYSMHRSKDVFGPDADEFRPERWEEGLRTTWEYIPFHGGPRICIGQQFALTQMLFTLFRVMQQFESIEAREHGPMQLRTSTTVAFANGCMVGMTPAKKPTVV